jgi:hypothetical protein
MDAPGTTQVKDKKEPKVPMLRRIICHGEIGAKLILAICFALMCIAIIIILFKNSDGTFQWKTVEYDGGSFHEHDANEQKETRIKQLEAWIVNQGLVAPVVPTARFTKR